jgi:hypothetical protein
VGSQTYDNVFYDREREDFADFESAGSCPLDADCVGVPNPATHGGGASGSGLLNLMVSHQPKPPQRMCRSRNSMMYQSLVLAARISVKLKFPKKQMLLL